MQVFSDDAGRRVCANDGASWCRVAWCTFVWMVRSVPDGAS